MFIIKKIYYNLILGANFLIGILSSETAATGFLCSSCEDKPECCIHTKKKKEKMKKIYKPHYMSRDFPCCVHSCTLDLFEMTLPLTFKTKFFSDFFFRDGIILLGLPAKTNTFIKNLYPKIRTIYTQ